MDKVYSFMRHKIFFTYLTAPAEFGLFPFILGYERCAKNKETIGPHTKSCHILHFVLSGRGNLTVDGREYTVGKDQLFYVPPDILTSYRPDPDDPWEYMWVEFYGSAAKFACKKAHLCADSPVLTPNDPGAVAEIFASLLNKNVSANTDTALASSALLFRLMAQLQEQNTADEVRELSRDRQKIQSVLDYIDENYCNPDTTLHTVAEQTFFNKSYLARVFRQTIGISPQKYIIELRLQRASEMLRHNNFSVSDIAAAVGYKSPYYFSLEFKKKFGVPPSQYAAIANAPQTSAPDDN